MEVPETTCWTMIQGAGRGDAGLRDDFARCYGPVVRAYLKARWRGSALLLEVEDAAQEVFVDCFRDGGVLERADPGRPGGFRSFLYGVIRTTALMTETRRGKSRERQAPSEPGLGQVEAHGESLSRVFDRAWVRMVVRDALERQRLAARSLGLRASRRVDLLRSRVYEGLPIREIAAQWGADAAWVHHEYAEARKEFKVALSEALTFHGADARATTSEALAGLLAVLDAPGSSQKG